MVSIIITFRFPSRKVCYEKEVDTVNNVFSYWSQIRKEHNVELVFINDYSDEFWINEDYIYPMTGRSSNWNIAAARNYGATLATGDKLLFTDIDHTLHGDIGQLDLLKMRNSYIKFNRFLKNGDEITPLKVHRNTFLINKNEFIGYDEDFCGNYGHEDSEFFFRLNKNHQRILLSQETAYFFVFKMPGIKVNRDPEINKQKFLNKTGSGY